MELDNKQVYIGIFAIAISCVVLIITTYNRPNMLIQAIESVLAQKAVQTEIIVVDDNSTEDNSFCIPLVSKYIKNKKNMY